VLVNETQINEYNKMTRSRVINF